MIDPEHNQLIARFTDKAFSHAQSGAINEAVEMFFLSRQLLVSNLEPSLIAHQRQVNDTQFHNEARRFAQALDSACPLQERQSKRLIILTDSLGMPRPAETRTNTFGIEKTYSYLLQQHALEEKQPDGGIPLRVHTWAQRYFTTRRLLSDWESIKGHLGGFAGAHLVVHLGLVDFTERMFLEDQRLALELVKPETKDRLIGFSQRYRRQIMERQRDHAYVPFPEFTANLYRIVCQAKQDDVASLSFMNIIAIPHELWKATPNLMWNLNRFNQTFYNLQHQGLCEVIDIDRIIWQNGIYSHLLEDKMHFSHQGHALVAKTLKTGFIGQ